MRPCQMTCSDFASAHSARQSHIWYISTLSTPTMKPRPLTRSTPRLAFEHQYLMDDIHSSPSRISVKSQLSPFLALSTSPKSRSELSPNKFSSGFITSPSSKPAVQPKVPPATTNLQELQLQLQQHKLIIARLQGYYGDRQLQQRQSILLRDLQDSHSRIMQSFRKVEEQRARGFWLAESQYNVSYFIYSKRAESRPTILRISAEGLYFEDQKILFQQISAVLYPDECTIAVSEERGKTHCFLFSLREQLLAFEKQLFYSYKQNTLGTEGKYFANQSFKPMVSKVFAKSQFWPSSSPQIKKVESQIPSVINLDLQLQQSHNRQLIGHINQSPSKRLFGTKAGGNQRTISINSFVNPRTSPSVVEPRTVTQSGLSPAKAIQPTRVSILNAMSKLSTGEGYQEVSNLVRGMTCLKYAEYGLQPHEKVLSFDKNKKWLVWTDAQDSSRSNYVKVNTITEVTPGRSSPGFAKYDKRFDPEKEGRSLVVRTNERVIELEMRRKEDRDQLQRALQIILRLVKS